MNVKEQVLEYLREHQSQAASGEQLAKSLGVSRAAVWKAVEALRREGFEIQAGTRRGYRLAENPGRLWEEEIRASLWPEYRRIPLVVYKTVDSTNREAGKKAMEGAPQGSLFVAEEQTAGRGQKGKAFYSPAQNGLYFSLCCARTRTSPKGRR